VDLIQDFLPQGSSECERLPRPMKAVDSRGAERNEVCSESFVGFEGKPLEHSPDLNLKRLLARWSTFPTFVNEGRRLFAGRYSVSWIDGGPARVEVDQGKVQFGFEGATRGAEEAPSHLVPKERVLVFDLADPRFEDGRHVTHPCPNLRSFGALGISRPRFRAFDSVASTASMMPRQATCPKIFKEPLAPDASHNDGYGCLARSGEAIPQERDTARKGAGLMKFELAGDVRWKRPLPAANQDRNGKDPQLVNEARSQCCSSQSSASHRKIRACAHLEPPNRLGIKRSLEARS